jgi:AmmeMemoRadiSam system protein B
LILNARTEVVTMQTRKPVVAGQFYPASGGACREEIEECLRARPLPETLPHQIGAGIGPHAGWTFSGALAALLFRAVKQRHETVDTFAIFGTAHRYFGGLPAVDETDAWETPLGTVAVDQALRDALVADGLILNDASAHIGEHSIEVHVPFVQHLFPDAAVLPIVVPANESGIALGQALARPERTAGKKVVCVGSTDLTHYGPRYGFIPQGPGDAGLRWAHEVNDRRFIDLALRLDPQGLLSTAREFGSACGPGAAAAAVAAAKESGATAGHLLAQTNSNEVMLSMRGAASSDSVGYAAIVF